MQEIYCVYLSDYLPVNVAPRTALNCMSFCEDKCIFGCAQN